ncbi:methyl-accepting chemotaxis protein [Paenibacillus caseinilyticus]|uniref:Chemotaxis protein n=1 Tax=Paenibacillus mucilaginosus K02 TaxID=997761 RepID=I0BV54_9BACL|nr:methyl-accepting chemotaxis protein [Paenibacillus mucilaginosus]AFH66251.1 chemotaxis protein [Paenibacillus mucilaginosus K02]
MFQLKSIQTKTMLAIVPLITITLVSMITYAYNSSETLINREIQDKMQQQLGSVAGEIDEKLLSHRKTAEMLARSIETAPSLWNLNHYQTATAKALGSSEDTFGVGVFFEPDKYQAGTRYFSTYGFKDGGKITHTEEYNAESYDYPKQPWYTIVANTKKTFVYTAPYYDETTKVTMVTTAVPFYDNKGGLLGVTTGDIDLANLQKLVQETKVGETGWAFLVDAEGNYLSDPAADKIMKVSLQKDPNVSLAAIGQDMLAGTMGEATYEDENGSNRVYYKKVAETGWVLSLVIPEKELQEPTRKLVVSLAVCGGVAIAVMAAIIVFFSRYLKKQISNANEMAGWIASGDLTHSIEVQTVDEFGHMGHNLNEMTAKLKEMIGSVSMHTHLVASTAEQLSASAEETSKATEQIADSVGQVASGTDMQAAVVASSKEAITGITQQILSIAEGIEGVNEGASRTAEKAKNGSRSVEEVTEHMKRIQANVHQSTEIVGVLSTKSQEIGQMISLITTISSQTNLLALNASIEASRAGEQGRGFAVVASEVRKLAEQSAQAADHIRGLISEVQSEINRAVQSMKEGNQAVNEGTALAENVSAAFGDIITAVEDTFRRVQAVSGSASVIRSDTRTMVDAVEQISEISNTAMDSTQSIAAAVEEQLASMQEVGAAAQTLSKMADELQDVVRAFRM